MLLTVLYCSELIAFTEVHEGIIYSIDDIIFFFYYWFYDTPPNAKAVSGNFFIPPVAATCLLRINKYVRYKLITARYVLFPQLQ